MLSRYFLSSFSNVENGKAARLLLIQRVKEHIAEMDIDPRMERFVLYISRHDIYQKFYTSRFSTIQKLGLGRGKARVKISGCFAGRGGAARFSVERGPAAPRISIAHGMS